MPDPIEAFAVIGDSRYYWSQFKGEAHIAIQRGRVYPPVIICDTLTMPEHVGGEAKLVEKRSLPFCRDCRKIIEDLYAGGARDLLENLKI